MGQNGFLGCLSQNRSPQEVNEKEANSTNTGVNPKDAGPAERDKLSISQAFLIDYLIKTISKNSGNSIFPPIFLYYYKRNESQIEIVRFLIRYFNAVKEIKSKDWENPSDSILTKGIGIGALIKVMYFLYVKLFIEEWKEIPGNMPNTSKDELVKKLKGLENVDFSKQGEFGGVGSGGSINKLAQRIVEQITFFGHPKYDDFIASYKSNVLKKYQTWYKANI